MIHKTHILFLCLCSFSFLCTAQELNVKEILKKADTHLEAASTLSYWIDFDMKYLSNEDTTRRRAICYLKNAPEDSMKVHHNVLDLKSNRQQLYDGKNILNVNFADSSALIINTELYGYSFITGNYIEDFIRYNLFKKGFFQDKLSDTSLIEAVPEETLFEGQEACSVTFRYKDEEDISNVVSTYFFRKSDGFPFGFRQTLNFQNMLQYKRYVLTNISINDSFDDNLFSLDYHIIDEAKTENYVPRERPPLLAEGEEAPGINRPTLEEGQLFDLADYQGKIVILDFWYRSCYPCIKALPGLQRISEEFDPSELVVIGVNTFDTREQIIPFLAERDINYTNIYDAKEVAQDYHISAYPTLYVIDQEGKVLSSHTGWYEGFYEDLKAELEELKK